VHANHYTTDGGAGQTIYRTCGGLDRITISGVIVSVHASSAVDRMNRITIGGVIVSVHTSSAVDRMDRITIGGVMVSVRW
jgi:hypothetical protein